MPCRLVTSVEKRKSPVAFASGPFGLVELIEEFVDLSSIKELS